MDNAPAGCAAARGGCGGDREADRARWARPHRLKVEAHRHPSDLGLTRRLPSRRLMSSTRAPPQNSTKRWRCFAVSGTALPLTCSPAMQPANGEFEAAQAYMFELGDSDLFAVTLDCTGSNLPAGDGSEWRLRDEFLLGVQDLMPVPLNPEPVLRSIRSKGYFTWHHFRSGFFGTSQ